MDPVGRVCTVTVSANGHVVVLQISFPASYPYNTPPSFQFIQGTSVNPSIKSKLHKVLLLSELPLLLMIHFDFIDFEICS